MTARRSDYTAADVQAKGWKMTYVPFTECDACWCQPFNVPPHPRCPMHGSLADCPHSETVAWRRAIEWLRQGERMAREQISRAKEHDAKIHADAGSADLHED